MLYRTLTIHKTQHASGSSSMDINTDPYRYRPLYGDQIRLLHLSAGLYHDELIVTLEHVDLKQQPKYEALSYTWGTSFKDCHVSFRTGTGVKKIAITKNLEAALLRLRSVEQTRVIWIDQVCINQDDIRERSSQVSRMGLIYASAFQVCIWIGEGTSLGNLPCLFWPIPCVDSLETRVV